MTESLKCTLYVSLAALMVASTGLASANNIVANAKRRPRISRRVHHARHYARRSYKRYHHIRRAHRSHRRTHHMVLRSGAFSGTRAPWKKAWNKYYKGHNIMITYGMARKEGVLPTTKYLNRIHRSSSAANDDSLNAWNKYFTNHAQKSHFTKHIVSYPQFDQLELANNNVGSEDAGNYNFIELPYHYSHDMDGRTNAELFGNQVLHNYTPSMRHSLRNVAVPATNGQRISKSYHHMMRVTHRHPTIKVGSLSYVLGNNNLFKLDSGTTKSGATYKFNPVKNRYQRVPTKQVAKKVAQAQNNAANLLQQKNDAEMQQIANNPVLTKQTKQLCLKLLQLPQVQQPFQVYKTASKSKKVTKPQRNRLAYMERSVIQHYEKVHARNVKAHTLALKRNFLYLQVHGAFNRMNHKQAHKLANKLAVNPKILRYYMREYGANTAARYTKHPMISKAKANHFAKHHSMTSNNALITSNKKLAREIAMLQYDIEALAKADGYILPSSTNQAQQF